MHFIQMIWAFSAPNGLCLSITESKHIKVGKKPYRRSSCYEALGQILLINQRVDKPAASQVTTYIYNAISLIHYYTAHGTARDAGENPEDEMEDGGGDRDGDGDGDREERDGSREGAGSHNIELLNNEDLDEDLDEDDQDNDEGLGKFSTPAVLANVYLAKTVHKCYPFITTHNQNTHLFTDHRVPPSVIAEDIQVPQFEGLIHKFLQQQLDLRPSELAEPLDLDGNISIYTSTVAVYHAPSDVCGIHGMAREHIHATS